MLLHVWERLSGILLPSRRLAKAEAVALEEGHAEPPSPRLRCLLWLQKMVFARVFMAVCPVLLGVVRAVWQCLGVLVVSTLYSALMVFGELW